MHRISLIVFKNFFVVTYETPQSHRMIEEFVRRFNTFTYVYDYKKKKKVRQVDKTFVAGNHYLNEYRFNISFIKDFMWVLRAQGLDKDSLTITKGPGPIVGNLDVGFNDDFTLRDYQVITSDDITHDKKSPTRLIGLQTGKGKTLTAANIVCRINEVTAILILPKYIDKWVSDIKELTKAKDDEIVVIRGGKDLCNIMMMAQSGEYLPKFIIFSNRTISLYIKHYESISDLDELEYPVAPADLMATLGIGTLMVDEVHQEFYSVFKASLYFNVNLILAMSATLENDDPNKVKYYDALFPPASRSVAIEYDRYIDVHSIRYDIKEHKRIKAVGNMGYSHVSFEQSLMRHDGQIRNYVQMIKHYIEIAFIKRRVAGDKVLVFAATVQLCTLLTDEFTRLYPNLKVRRYVDDDDYSHVMEGEIIFSTVLSSGTALDIKGLITVLQTISMKSNQANLQSLGRLRKVEGKNMEYYYLYTRTIPKQEEYHRHRTELFKSKVKKFFLEEYHKTI